MYLNSETVCFYEEVCTISVRSFLIYILPYSKRYVREGCKMGGGCLYFLNTYNYYKRRERKMVLYKSVSMRKKGCDEAKWRGKWNSLGPLSWISSWFVSGVAGWPHFILYLLHLPTFCRRLVIIATTITDIP